MYCSKLSMQTENLILKQLCSFAMRNSIDEPSWLLLNSFLVTNSLLAESAKSLALRALRALVPCVPTCPRALVPCLPTCPCAHVPCVPSCPRALVPCVPTCPRVLRALVPMWASGRYYYLFSACCYFSC